MRRSLLSGLLLPICHYPNFVQRVPVYDSALIPLLRGILCPMMFKPNSSA
jgi:hypothetical protein